MPTGQTCQCVHGNRWAVWYASHTKAVNKYTRNGTVYFINGEDCHVMLIVKWMANEPLTIEAMSPKLLVSLL